MAYPTFTVGSGLFQVNIAPVISSFPTALDQLQYYQQYRITKVSYKILPWTNVNTTANTTVMLYDVGIYG